MPYSIVWYVKQMFKVCMCVGAGGGAKEGLDLKMSSDLTLIWHQTKSDIILSECWDGWGLCVWLNRYNKKDFKF